MDIERLGVANIIGAPDAVNELAAGKYAAGVAQQVLQEVEFLEGHGNRLARDGNGVAFHVHLDAAALEDLLGYFFLRLGIGARAGIVAAAQDRADAGDELAGGIRLGHVIISAELKADDLVDLGITCGHHDDRHGRGGAQLLAYLGAGHAGQHEV